MRPATLSPEQKQVYNSALATLLAYQNKDGSWGSSKEGKKEDKENKITNTSQMIQLMLSLNVKADEPIFTKAVKWIEDEIEIGDPHWATEVEIELKIGNFKQLFSDKRGRAFFEALEHDYGKSGDDPADLPNEKHLDLFWHVIPTVIELLPYLDELKQLGYEIPFAAIDKHIEQFCRLYEGGCIAVNNHPNHTGLIALYYAKLSKCAGFEEYKAKSEAMARWLLECRINDTTGTNWLNSKSITAYVLIDLLNSLDYAQISEHIDGIVRFLLPPSDGIFKGDKNTTFNTKVHAEWLYTTVLVLRAIAELMKVTGSTSFDTLFQEVKNNKKLIISKKTKRFLKNLRRSIPFSLSILITLAGVICYCFGSDEAGQIIVSTGVAGALGIFFDWILKPSD